MPNLYRLYKAGQGDHRACGGDALSRALAFRRPGRAGERPRQARLRCIPAGSTARSTSLTPEHRVGDNKAFAVGPVTPLVVRGTAPVMSWVPPHALKQITDDTVLRLLDLYNHTDPALARALEGRHGADHARPRRRRCEGKPAKPSRSSGGIEAARAYFAEAAGTAAKYLARADGPRIGALAFNGWDTHINEGAASGLLANPARWLDGAIAAMEAQHGRRPGAKLSSPSSPSSAAPRASTAPTAPITAPAR